MNDEIKKEEGKAEENKINITANEALGDGNEEENESQTVDQIELEKKEKNKTKNLVAMVILLVGFVVGSVFVDVVQFATGSGYSEKALKNAQTFESAGKTWVSYNDPPVKVDVLTVVNEDDLKNCPKCDPTDVLVWLRRFVPTMIAKKIDISSPEGKKIAENYGVKTIPAFVFDGKLGNTEFYNGEAKVLFEEKDNNYLLNSSQLGIPVGKYLETPQIGQDDPAIGSKDAKVKVVVYSDFQCPYCKQFYSIITKVAKQRPNDVELAYKELPLEFHPQAQNAAQVAMCANEQGKFWQMADLLYSSQDVWGQAEGKDVFKQYASKVGLDATKFNKCLTDNPYQDKIDQDTEEAKNYGISGTPSGFIGNQFIGGAMTEDEVNKMIDDETKQ